MIFIKRIGNFCTRVPFNRLKSPFEGNDTAWIVVSEDQKQAIAAYYQTLNPANAGWLRLKFAGLGEDVLYQVTVEGDTGEYYGVS